MNDPNKAINVNLSSLLSLKAELLRKQAEVNRAKATQIAPEEYVASRNNTSSSFSKRDKKEQAKAIEQREDATVYEHEDTELLEKSKRVLTAKSKFYERMSRTGGKLNSDDNCLVLFNRKRQEEGSIEKVAERTPSSDSELSSSDSEDAHNNADPEEDWVEYTDCLGRTRKCLRKDLEFVKKRDDELAASMPERLDQTKANWMLDTKGSRANDDDNDDDLPIGPMASESVYNDGCSMMSKHDEQRANWERKEQENLDKKDVHYQDVFFDEARQHGVGYYAFSTDEEERRKQQRELEETRLRTIAEQKQRDELRAQREKIIAERVRAAKNRQRARLGLPPLEESEEEKSAEVTEPETKEERKARKRAEKLKRKQEKEEQEREAERQRHVRPWDKQKDGVAKSVNAADSENTEAETEWTYKPEREPMSQAQWNEMKRAERIAEFAPAPERAPTVQPKRTNFNSMPPPPAAPVRNYNMVPPPATIPSPMTPIMDETFASFQSSKRNKTFHRRSYEASSEQQEKLSMRTGVTIPPPADLDDDCMLPPQSKKPKSTVELERSIEAGLRFLRNNCDKGNMSTKSSWTAKADY